MARFYFGKNEDLKCLPGVKDFKIVTSGELGAKEDVCFAAKVSTDHLFLPWRVEVEDYVLAVKGTGKYFELTRSQVRYQQSIGNLPKDLPRYNLSTMEVVWGNLLWITIGSMAIFVALSFIQERIKSRSEHENSGAEPDAESHQKQESDKNE